MDDKSKIIIVEEKELIPHTGEVNPEKPPEPKYNFISTRRFLIRKFDAKASLKVSKLLIAKILPMLDTFMPSVVGGISGVLTSGNVSDLADADTIGKLLSSLSLEKIANALDLIDDNDLDKIIDISLRHCFEQLSAGPVQVLNPNGTYGVSNIEYDMMLMLRLTAEAILWSVGGFFDATRWGSMFSPLADSLPLNA